MKAGLIPDETVVEAALADALDPERSDEFLRDRVEQEDDGGRIVSAVG